MQNVTCPIPATVLISKQSTYTYNILYANVMYCNAIMMTRNTNEEEQVALWREGRRREPNPVEVDF